MNALSKIGFAAFAAALVPLSMQAESSVNVAVTPRSSMFDPKVVERDPFLPIGWQKKTVVQEKSHQITITPDAFRVTSIIIGGGGAGLAIINGSGYAAGESIRINVGGREVGVRVKEVRDGEVVFLHNGQEIHASLVNQ
jgi:hypothetical protein